MNDEKRTGEEILARARRAWSPSAADAERVRRAASLALSGSAAPRPSVAPPGAPAWAPKLLAAGLIASMSGGAGYWLGHRAGVRAALPVAPVTAPVPVVEPLAVATTNAAPDPGGARPFASAPVTVHREPRDASGPRRGAGAGVGSPAETGSLAIELRALRNAERALRDGTPGLALAFLRELDRQVPRGQLTEERDAAATLAHCAAGDRPFGVDFAADFIERYPRSVYRARVEQTCAATDSATPGDSSARRPEK